MTISEFSITLDWQSDRRGPVRWLLSHVMRHKPFIVGVLFGAFSNAALAAAVPVLIGQSFDLVGSSPADMAGLGRVAAGKVMARATNDVRVINLMFNPGINLVVGSANFLFMPLFVAPSIHPQLLLAPLTYLLAYLISVWDYLRRLNPAADRVRRSFGWMNTAMLSCRNTFGNHHQSGGTTSA